MTLDELEQRVRQLEDRVKELEYFKYKEESANVALGLYLLDQYESIEPRRYVNICGIIKKI